MRPDDLLIVNVAVAPAHQGRGLGRHLLAYAESLARAAALPTVRLYTNARMTANLTLYASYGFVEERREILEVGTVVHMAKPLGPVA